MQLQKRRKTSVLVTVTWNVRNVSAAPQIPGQFEINLLDFSYSVVIVYSIPYKSIVLVGTFGTLVTAAI